MDKQKKKRKFLIGEKQQAAVTMLVDGGYRLQEVAYALGVHRTTVWRWFRHTEMQKYFNRYQEKQFRKIARVMRNEEEARLKKLTAKLDSDNPWLANAAAIAILDRYGDWFKKWLMA
ncbi:MAG: helix-turn-helix domain-containing protein [Clostridiales bacterium]|nr:helix-turn-helix domain-containing protein [Clostridiales bacterium]